MKTVRKTTLALRREAVMLRRETEIYPKQGESSGFAFLTRKPWARSMWQCKKLLWAAQRKDWKVAFVSGKVLFSVALPCNFICPRACSCPDSASALFHPHCTQVTAHTVYNWVANDIIQGTTFFKHGFKQRLLCVLKPRLAIRTCQTDLLCKSWWADFHEGRVKPGLFLSPAAPFLITAALVLWKCGQNDNPIQ